MENDPARQQEISLDSSEKAFDNIQQLPGLPRDRYDLRILRSIRQLIRAVDTYSKKLATERGMTVPQLVCIMKIDELGSLSLKQLAEEVFISPSTVVGIVDRLEKHGMVIRERSVRDRRLLRICLTEKGREILAENPSPMHEAFSDSLNDLPELEKATIAMSFEKTVDLMEVKRRNAAPILESRPDLEPPADLEPKRV